MRFINFFVKGMTFIIISRGGVVKHQIIIANLWRNGTDYGDFINTGIMQDGSDSGVIPWEISWGR